MFCPVSIDELLSIAVGMRLMTHRTLEHDCNDTLWHTRSITDAYRHFLIYQI